MGHKFKTYFRTNKAYYPQISKTKSQTELIVASAESRRGNACVEAKTADAEVKGDVSGYAVEPLSWAVAEGLIKGTDNGNGILLDPQGNATRAQVATIIMRFIRTAAGK